MSTIFVEAVIAKGVSVGVAGLTAGATVTSASPEVVVKLNLKLGRFAVAAIIPPAVGMVATSEFGVAPGVVGQLPGIHFGIKMSISFALGDHGNEITASLWLPIAFSSVHPPKAPHAGDVYGLDGAEVITPPSSKVRPESVANGLSLRYFLNQIL
jgi:hypothetical protein